MSRRSLTPLAETAEELVIKLGVVLLVESRGLVMLDQFQWLMFLVLTLLLSRKGRSRQVPSVGSVPCAKTGTLSSVPRSRRCGPRTGFSDVKPLEIFLTSWTAGCLRRL